MPPLVAPILPLESDPLDSAGANERMDDKGKGQGKGKAGGHRLQIIKEEDDLMNLIA